LRNTGLDSSSFSLTTELLEYRQKLDNPTSAYVTKSFTSKSNGLVN